MAIPLSQVHSNTSENCEERDEHGDEDRRAHVRSAMSRLAELSSHLPPNLKKADWVTKREIIRAVVQRIEIGPTNIGIVLRLPAGMSARTVEPILVTLSRA